MGEETPIRKKLTETDIDRMMIPRRYWGATFGEISDGGDNSPKKIAHRYISKLSDMVVRGVGLILWGKNGRGKTGLAVVIGKEARRRGFSVLYAECADLKRCVIDRVAFDEDQSMWERARSVDMLILDDLGKGTQDSKGFGARLMDELIRHRNANRRATFITMNMNPRDQLKEELKTSTVQSLKECCIPCEIKGPDRRDKEAAELNELLTAEG